MHALGGNLREEIHVREAGDATFDLLGDGQVGAVADKILVDPFGFGWPDVVFQPGHQRQVVGQAAEQGHRRMSVSIDQAGAEQDVRQFSHFACIKLQGGGTWADEDNASVADAQAWSLRTTPAGSTGTSQVGSNNRSSAAAVFGIEGRFQCFCKGWRSIPERLRGGSL
jgi:hypothetical protein